MNEIKDLNFDEAGMSALLEGPATWYGLGAGSAGACTAGYLRSDAQQVCFGRTLPDVGAHSLLQ